MLRKRWAGFLTVIISGSFIPLEAYEVVEKYNHIKLAVLIVNAGIVVYLVWKLRQETQDEARLVAEPEPAAGTIGIGQPGADLRCGRRATWRPRRGS